MVEKGRSGGARSKGVCFVTGSDGRLGQALVRSLISSGYSVRALVKNKELVLGLPSGVIPYIGDITNRKVLDNGCDGADCVFHLAAIVNSNKITTNEMLNVNVTGTANILEASEKGGVGRLVFTSSVDVYGVRRKGVLTEQAKLEPNDRYGYSKMLAEEEINEFSGSMKYSILRLSTIYGPGFEKSFFKIFRGIESKKVYIIGNGENHLSLEHVVDVVQALRLAYEKTGSSKSGVYNINDGKAHTQKELFNLAADMLGVERPSKHVSRLIVKIVAQSKGIDSDELRFLTSDRQIDISKARKELGYSPTVSIEKGGMRMVEEFKKRGRDS